MFIIRRARATKVWMKKKKIQTPRRERRQATPTVKRKKKNILW
jgi:hypothetical protein